MRYELIYILPATLSDADLPAAKAKVDGLLARLGVTAIKNDHAGKLKMAYPMMHQRYGHYLKVELEAEPAAAHKLAKELQLVPDVMRAQVIRLDGPAHGPATLISHEEAGVRARETARAAAAHRAAPAPLSAPVASPLPPAVKLTEEQIEEKIEKILSDESLQGV